MLLRSRPGGSSTFFTCATLHRLGKTAAQTIEPRCGTWAVLLLVAGIGPLHRRKLPARRITARLSASNCRF